MNWYKAQIRHLNAYDEKELPKEKYYIDGKRHKVMLIACKRDPVRVPMLQEKGMKEFVKGGYVSREVDSGHWGQSERREEVNELSRGFLEGEVA